MNGNNFFIQKNKLGHNFKDVFANLFYNVVNVKGILIFINIVLFKKCHFHRAFLLSKFQLDEKHKLQIKNYISLPFLSDDLNDPQMISKIPSNLMFQARESLVIKTLLCSGKFTSNGMYITINPIRSEL